jgi:hypothetical protein
MEKKKENAGLDVSQQYRDIESNLLKQSGTDLLEKLAFLLFTKPSVCPMPLSISPPSFFPLSHSSTVSHLFPFPVFKLVCLSSLCWL